MLDQITSIADIVGAAGVILSLLYVGKQLKQTNSMSRSAVHLARSEASVSWATNIACTPGLCETLAKLHFHDLDRESATEIERIQLGYLFSAMIGQIQMSFEQRKEGIITQDELENYFGPGSAVVNLPYLATVWAATRHGYPADFRAWFEERYRYSADSAPSAALD